VECLHVERIQPWLVVGLTYISFIDENLIAICIVSCSGWNIEMYFRF
jgi:hypothetical protein